MTTVYTDGDDDDDDGDDGDDDRLRGRMQKTYSWL